MGASPEHEMSFNMIVVRLQQTFPFRVGEWLLALVMISWGLTLLWYPNLFAITPTYIFMAQMAPQPQWGVWILLTGLVRFAVLTINGAWRPSPHIRAACALFSSFVWLQICLGIAASRIPSTGLAVYPYFLLLDFYNILRASSDARASDDRARGV